MKLYFFFIIYRQYLYSTPTQVAVPSLPKIYFVRKMISPATYVCKFKQRYDNVTWYTNANQRIYEQCFIVIQKNVYCVSDVFIVLVSAACIQLFEENVIILIDICIYQLYFSLPIKCKYISM